MYRFTKISNSDGQPHKPVESAQWVANRPIEQRVTTESPDEWTVNNGGKQRGTHEKSGPQQKNPVRRKRVPKNQARVLKPPSDSTSYAEIVRKVKIVVANEKHEYDICTRKTKIDNILLELPEKEKADRVAEAVKTTMGDQIDIRRPTPSIAILVSEIEDKVEMEELKQTLINFDQDFVGVGEFKIRKSKYNRTAVIRTPIRAGLKLVSARKIKIG